MKKGIALVCMLFVGVISFGQTLNLEWSEKMEYDKENGFLTNIIGETKSNLFLRFYDYKINPLTGMKTKQKNKILIFDKKSKKKTKTIVLQDFKDNKEVELEKLDYYSSCISNNTIYIFWKTNRATSMKVVDIFVQTFDTLCIPISPLKKVTTLKNSPQLKDPQINQIHVCSNKKSNNVNILIEYDKGPKTASYDIFNLTPQLVISKPYKFELPYETNNEAYTLPLVEFKMLNSGYIEGKWLSNTVLINPEQSKKVILNQKNDGKIINSIKSYEDKNGLQFFGTYYVKNSKNLSEKQAGIVKIKFDESLFKVQDYSYIPFTLEQMNKMYPPVPEKEQYLEYTNSLIGAIKNHINFMNVELDEIVLNGSDLTLILTKSYYEIGTIIRGVQPLIINDRYDYIPVKLINEKELNVLSIINRKAAYNWFAYPQDITSINEGELIYSIFGDTPTYGKDDPNGYVFHSRLNYVVTNTKTGNSERKYFQLYNPKDNSSKRTFDRYPIDLKSEYDNKIYFITKGDNLEKDTKFIGQLSITK
jgi:hypothetical protein